MERMNLNAAPTAAHLLSGMTRWLRAITPRHAMAILALAAIVLMTTSGAQAALTYSGNLNPVNPAAWGTSTNARVGDTADGSLTLDGGSSVTSKNSYLGYNAGVTGTVTVTAGSTWTTGTSSSRYIGYYGTGVLNITNGGMVSNTSSGYLGYYAGSTGTATVDGSSSKWSTNTLYVGNNGSGTLGITNGGVVTVTNSTYVGTLGAINFGSNGGTLTTGTLFAAPSQLSGTGTINTSGIFSDIDLAFNAAHGTTQSINMNGVTVNLSQSSTKALGVGYLGIGNLSITDGVTVSSSWGYLGYKTGSTGTGTVDGSGSTWTNGGLDVGYNSTGTLNVANGASVTSTGNITVGNNGTGTLNVINSASVTTSGDLTVAKTAAGTLHIANGGTVSVTGNTTVGSLGAINFGTNGGSLTTGGLQAAWSQINGTGTINTSGFVGDANLTFNAATGTTQSFAVKGVTVNLDQKAANALGVGYLGSGSMSITDAVAVSSATGYLGYNAGSAGIATISGENSRWMTTGNMNVGYNGNGTLNISNRGSGNFSSYVYVGYTAGTTGIINVDGAGSYMGNTGLTVGRDGTGTLAITNGATVVSGGITYIAAGIGSVGSAIVSGKNSRWAGGADIYVGNSGTGSMQIKNGGVVTNRFAYIGCSNGAVGSVTVDGAESVWNTSTPNTYGLSVGYDGKGRLYITNGGTVNSGLSWVGPGIVGSSTGSGYATVDGVGSKWNNSGSTFDIGQKGTGKLSISNGGAVSSAYLKIYNQGLLTLDVGKGSSLTVNGTLTNSGTMRIVAGAAAANGTYTPITATTWAGTGTVQALGGLWDNDTHTVTVSNAVTAQGAGGASVIIDLSQDQRLLITDSISGKSIGAAFQGTAPGVTMNLTFTGSLISGTELSSLQGLLTGTGKSVLSGWNITTGYSNPVYLSLFAGNASSLSDLTVWHFDATNGWTKYDATDLAYDKTFASFTVDGFSGYAVSGTAPVPIPPAFLLLGSGLAGLGFIKKRIFNSKK
jgi:large repetitive protein